MKRLTVASYTFNLHGSLFSILMLIPFYCSDDCSWSKECVCCSTLAWTYPVGSPSHGHTLSGHPHMDIPCRVTLTWTYPVGSPSHGHTLSGHPHMDIPCRVTLALYMPCQVTLVCVHTCWVMLLAMKMFYNELYQ